MLVFFPNLFNNAFSTAGLVIRASSAAGFGVSMCGIKAAGFDLNLDSETNFPVWDRVEISKMNCSEG